MKDSLRDKRNKGLKKMKTQIKSVHASLCSGSILFTCWHLICSLINFVSDFHITLMLSSTQQLMEIMEVMGEMGKRSLNLTFQRFLVFG